MSFNLNKNGPAEHALVALIKSLQYIPDGELTIVVYDIALTLGMLVPEDDKTDIYVRLSTELSDLQSKILQYRKKNQTSKIALSIGEFLGSLNFCKRL